MALFLKRQATSLILRGDYTDSELIKRLANDSQEAFELLYARYGEELFHTAFYLLRDTDAAKDVLQDVFVWLWEHRHTLDIQNVQAYLKAAVRFKVANYIRSGRIRNSFFDELAKFPQQPDALPSSTERVEVRELQRIIQQAVIQLPQKCREIYRLSREECLSNREIAERLGVSVKTVENQMTIALRRIRSVVELHVVFLVVLLALYGH